jgi:nucleoside-diphosphate-sugar epimerase
VTAYPESVEGKTCLVTGGAGFIGSHLCAKLLGLGARVISVDLEGAKDGTLFKLLNLSDAVESLTVDLSEPSAIEQITEQKPDRIFHLCGLPYAPYTSLHPVRTFRANVASTANMLEAARQVSAERFILASSACVFGATKSSPLSIDGKRCKGEHYYTYTKRQAESVAESYSEFYGVPASICRFVNVYGPGDRHFGRLIPALCKQLIESESQELTLFRSSGDSVFEFLYVDDAVSGLLNAAEYGDSGCEIHHFGPGYTARTSAREIAERLSVLFDNRERRITTKSQGGEKTVAKYLDTGDTASSLGWVPRWGLDAGLSETVRWYERNIEKMEPFDDADLALSASGA